MRVQDSQGTPDVDTQALSITIDAAGGEATYWQAASDTETSTTSTTYVTKTTLQFTPTAADTYLILAFAEYKPGTIDYNTSVRLVIDGSTEGLATMMPKTATEYIPFVASKVTTLSAAQHTMTIDYVSSNAAHTSYIRRARIVAIRKASLEMYSNAADAEVSLNTTPVDLAPVTFTPATAGDYLLVFTAESMGQWSYSSIIQPKLNSTILDEGAVASRADVNFDSFGSFCVATLPASSQTVKFTASANGPGIYNARRFRVTAVRLSDGRLSTYASAGSDGTSATTSTTFVEKLSKTWTSGSTGNWLILSSGRLNGSGSSAAEAQLQYNNSTTLGTTSRAMQATTEWKNYVGVGVQAILAGSRQTDTDYRSGSSSDTCTIKYCHEVMLPLDGGAGYPDLQVTTTSLPDGAVGSAYSQTLAATGGLDALHVVSSVSGSLPTGLTLGSSTGIISGTPTAANTYNFTVRCTDSQGTPDTDDQALSIAVTAPAATYQFAASDTEANTTSTTYQAKTTLSFTSSATDDWVVLSFAEYKGSSESYSTYVRTVVDGTVESEILGEPNDATDYMSYSSVKLRNLAAGSHTMTVDYRSENAGATASIRNARIVAIRKAALEVQSTASDSGGRAHDDACRHGDAYLYPRIGRGLPGHLVRRDKRQYRLLHKNPGKCAGSDMGRGLGGVQGQYRLLPLDELCHLRGTCLLDHLQDNRGEGDRFHRDSQHQEGQDCGDPA